MSYMLLCSLHLMIFDLRDSDEQHVWLYDRDTRRSSSGLWCYSKVIYINTGSCLARTERWIFHCLILFFHIIWYFSDLSFQWSPAGCCSACSTRIAAAIACSLRVLLMGIWFMNDRCQELLRRGQPYNWNVDHGFVDQIFFFQWYIYVLVCIHQHKLNY